MKPFHVVVLGVFLGLALLSVIIIALFRAGGQETHGTIIVWGSLSESTMSQINGALSKVSNNAFNEVKYTAYPDNQLIPALVDAIAGGTSPDLVVFPVSALLEDGDKLQTISYNRLSRRDFQDTFIEAAEVLLMKDGFQGYPFVVDPLVMYWNRSLFSEAGVARPPKYWDELLENTPKLTVHDERGGITQSAVALGSWQNIVNAKGIFLTLLWQLGNPVIVLTDKGFSSVFAASEKNGTASAESTLRFYTEFADPVKSSYSWNSARPLSRDAFIAGSLAIYFGRASELKALRAANPNLNFDVAPVPATRGAGTGAEATLFALSVPRGARNIEGAIAYAQALSGQSLQQELFTVTTLPSVRRDSIVVSPDNPYTHIFNTAALSAFSFRDPGMSDSNAIFMRAVTHVLSGQLRTGEAILTANAELEALLH